MRWGTGRFFAWPRRGALLLRGGGLPWDYSGVSSISPDAGAAVPGAAEPVRRRGRSPPTAGRSGSSSCMAHRQPAMPGLAADAAGGQSGPPVDRSVATLARGCGGPTAAAGARRCQSVTVAAAARAIALALQSREVADVHRRRLRRPAGAGGRTDADDVVATLPASAEVRPLANSVPVVATACDNDARPGDAPRQLRDLQARIRGGRSSAITCVRRHSDASRSSEIRGREAAEKRV